MEFIENYIEEIKEIVSKLDRGRITRMVDLLAEARKQGGRIFFLGVGGGAGHASHAVNDFRKICGIESYTPTDNVSELTARVNDEGWDTSYLNWLRVNKLKKNDVIFVFSVGGGDIKRNISVNIVNSLRYAKEMGAKICGVVGRDGGYTAQVADSCVIIPPVNAETVTAHTEGFQAVIWHLLVSHPRLKQNEMKWESTR
ncbi:MAG: SIS domain-containing protein [Deltaproteobacteria bacterium]|nr:SIS domain-containing protein [Deltaproteobacteria bacterium]